MGIRRIVNARVLTMEGGGAADSVEIDGGRIVAVMSAPTRRPEPSRNATPSSRPPRPIHLDRDSDTMDLGGRTLVPGFIDCHLHLVLAGLSLARLDLSLVRSRAGFERAVAERHATLSPGEWLLGGGWSERNWAGHAAPDATWLDGCGNRPAALYRMDHHACVVNRAVLSRIDSRRDPPGGRIVRDASGAPTGLLQESAAWGLVEPLVPPPSAPAKRAATAAACSRLLSLGITTAMSMELADDVRDVLEPLRAELRPRVLVTLLDGDASKAIEYVKRFAGDDRLRVIGVKAFLDGTLGSRTARMLDPYADVDPAAPDARGLWIGLAAEGERPDALRACVDWATAVAAAGLSPSMHAIGDAALRLALDVAELVPGAGVRIEHAQTAHPDDVPRTRGRWLSMQPLHRADDARFAMERLGPARMNRFFPFRRYLDAGAMLAFGSDWPIVSPDPIEGMRSAITARTADGGSVGADQALTPLEALRGWTCDAARMLGLDDLGTIRRGASADFAVLSHDPLGADWIDDPPRVEATVCDGALAWSRRTTT